MKKVFLKRKLNEDITISDPNLAKQYLAVKKQILDKERRKDDTMKTVNQINNEINILEKNLLAIQTQAAQREGQKPPQQAQQDQQQTQQDQQQVQESHLPNIEDIDDFREEVIRILNEITHDGETLAYLHNDEVKRGYENKISPEDVAGNILRTEAMYATDDTDSEFFRDEEIGREREFERRYKGIGG